MRRAPLTFSRRLPAERDPARGRFRNPMDPRSIRARLGRVGDDAAYRLAVRAAGHQSAYTVDLLAHDLRAALPELVARLAEQIEKDIETHAERAIVERENETL